MGINIQLNFRPCTSYKGDTSLTPCRYARGSAVSLARRQVYRDDQA